MVESHHCTQFSTHSEGYWYHRTPLHNASQNGRLDVVNYLIEDMKVDSSCQDVNDATPLHQAAYCGQLSAVKLLVEGYQCDPGVRAKNGETPADRATSQGHTHITFYLSSIEKIVSSECEGTTTSKLCTIHEC